MNAQAKPDQYAANMQARNVLLANSIDMCQEIFSQTLSGDPRGQNINISPRNVGFIKKFTVEISGTIAQAASETLTRTAFSGANILSDIVFTDLANQTRIDTTGWHAHLLACARRQKNFAAAYTTDSPVDVASNYQVADVPSSVTTADTFRFFYELPISYSDMDLRGGIYANVVNATMNIQLTLNNGFVVASTGNPTTAVYISNGTDLGTLSNVTVKVYQHYLDQVPMSNEGPIVPLLDMSTAYVLNDTVVTGLTVNTDIAIPYANFRDFMSTIVIYDDFGGSGDPGSTINYWALQSANYTNIWKKDPFMCALMMRNLIGDDFPAEAARNSFLFDNRSRPISTVQYGNMQLVGNFSNVQGSTSQILVGYEALAIINQITQAGSLYNT